ncbi:MAG: metal-sensitive transcriptional regulator [Candidatus Pacebacteria bacterium]|jgi:DNA-binding FrmR family transcriptional regulator|nr:metal-sensitive transcriptional regulator [Candidatus Paceibacterota bacterium]MBT4652248.1 metal-sensitive transcriptional regulator [Candidatus Paceibacterota bacterium]MBT6756660.1 metal-sensitive transcriptional regulator [Candidatus Paceibacterota bacterium]MBT6921424.1 metal-sensitive transcriptional regulator [Candidatus Paceibacterota bacterium]
MPTKKDPISAQLNRINGQVEGISKMYHDERACVDIVRQVIAVRSSLGRVARDLLSSEAKRCSRGEKWDTLDDVLKEVFRY